MWNLRLELGHRLAPAPLRITEFAPARAGAASHTALIDGYASPEAGLSGSLGPLLWHPDKLTAVPSAQARKGPVKFESLIVISSPLGRFASLKTSRAAF